MCDCNEKIIEKIKAEFGKSRKPVLKAKISGLTFGVDKEMNVTDIRTIDFIATLENQKKKLTVPVAYSYCPFCGEALKDD